MADEMISLDTSKFAPGAEQLRQDVAIGVSIAMTLTGMVCVALRVFTRAYIVRNMGTEDIVMIIAAALTFALTLEFLVGARKYLMGFSGMSLTPLMMERNIQMILAMVVTYKMVVTLVKISILIIYLRLAVIKIFERLCKGTIILLATWQLIVTIVVPAQCTPLEKLWDFTGQVKGTCINANAFYHVTSAFHIVMDLWILVLPIKFVLAIPRPPREKLALYFVFGLGFFSMVASIIRLQYLRQFTLSSDPFYDSLPINMWSLIEVNIGILCASLPTLKPLVSKAQRTRTREVLNQHNHTWKSDSTGRSSTTKGPRIVHAKEVSVSSPLSFRSQSSWPSSISGKASTFASSLKSAKSSIFSVSLRSSREPPSDEEVELVGLDVPPPVPPKDDPPSYSRSPTLNTPTIIQPKKQLQPSQKSSIETLNDAYRELEQTLQLPATVYTPPR